MGQNIQAKFNEKQNEVRIAIMNFIIDNKRPFHMKQDGYDALEGITLSGRHEFQDILDVLHSRDGFSWYHRPPCWNGTTHSTRQN